MQGVLVGESVAGLYWLVAGQLRVVGGETECGWLAAVGGCIGWGAVSWVRRWLVGLYRAVSWWRQQGVGCGDIKKAPGTSVSGAEGAATYSPACAVPSA